MIIKIFSIKVPDGYTAKEWAAMFWDTYSFDYDKEKAVNDSIMAWSYGCTDNDLEESLKCDGISFTTFDWTEEELEAYFNNLI